MQISAGFTITYTFSKGSKINVNCSLQKIKYKKIKYCKLNQIKACLSAVIAQEKKGYKKLH